MTPYNFEQIQTDLVQLVGSKAGAVAPTITPSASFAYTSSEEAEGIFKGEVAKPLYARMGNPTGVKLENIFAELEGGIGAVITSSGMGAITMCVTALAESGDEILCVGGFFGGTYALMSETMPRFGVTGLFCDVDDMDFIESSLKKGMKMVLLESVGNPNLKLPDLQKISALCQTYETLLVVDNTSTPLIIKPLDIGADIVVYSTTKNISGHSAALGGVAIFRAVGEKDKLWSDKYSSIHPILKKGKKALMMVLKKRAMRDFGMSASAFNAFLTMIGLETLALRLQRINQSIETLCGTLDDAGVDVRHPSLAKHEHSARYKTDFVDGCGPVFTIDMGSREKAFALLNNTKLLTQSANIGDNRTLGLHMASTIYRDFDEEQKEFLGITDGLIRLSMGLESPRLIAEDILQAYQKVN